MPTPEKIEVKFAVAPSDTGRALADFGPLAEEPEEYTVHFFDRQPLALFADEVILRVRQTVATGAKDDATFKVRGDRAAPTFLKFGAGTGKRKFEGDQNAGAGVKDSFSITAEPPLAKIDAVLAGKIPLYAAFEPDAVRFLEAAGFPGDTLLAYGPIEARKWKVKLTGFKGKVTVEWWRTGNVELVEISDKVPEGEAKAFGDALGAHMRVLGLAQLNGSKTEFALNSVKPFAISTAG